MIFLTEIRLKMDVYGVLLLNQSLLKVYEYQFIAGNHCIHKIHCIHTVNYKQLGVNYVSQRHQFTLSQTASSSR